jgi:hypothetical protein
MSHDPLFDSAWFKWANALAHAEALQEDITARSEDKATPSFGFRSSYHPNRHGFAIKVEETEPIPIRWRLLLGDVANNYRAALDHLAWGLVLRGRESGKLTRKQENAVYFPYARSRTSFNGELSRKLPGVKRADVAKIRKCQPYHHPHQSQARHALVLLAGINNGDKHRTIQPVWAQPTRIDIAIDQTIDCVVSGPTFGRSGQAIEVGAELAFVRARRTGPAPRIRVDLGLTAEPSLEKPHPRPEVAYAMRAADPSTPCGVLQTAAGHRCRRRHDGSTGS